MWFPSALLAYIDPVSGVILLQLFIGGAIGVIARVRHRIWRLISGFFVKPQAEEDTAELLTQPLGHPDLPMAGGAAVDSRAHDESQYLQKSKKAA